jgi:putative sigma-54 modulation protein
MKESTMNLDINGRHLDITPAIRDYVQAKLSRVKRHFDHMIGMSITLSVIRIEHTAEVTLHVPGRDIHAQATNQDMYAAIDALADKLERQVQRYKEKITNHNHKPLKHQHSQLTELETET